MKNVIRMLAVLTVFAIVMTGCGKNATSVNTVGNTPGNITNGGLIAQQGDRLYYSNASDGYKLYTVKTDGSGKQKLSDDLAEFINVVGDRIYYYNKIESGYPTLYSIKTDGRDKRKLINDRMFDIYVVGDWIYYYDGIDSVSPGKIYRIKTDGSGKQKICDDLTCAMTVVNDLIYYIDFQNRIICSIKTDGSDKQKITDYNLGTSTLLHYKLYK